MVDHSRNSHIYEHNIFHMAKQVWIWNIQWVIYLPSSTVKKYCPELLSLNTYFTNWQKYRINKFSNVSYHVLNLYKYSSYSNA